MRTVTATDERRQSPENREGLTDLNAGPNVGGGLPPPTMVLQCCWVIGFRERRQSAEKREGLTDLNAGPNVGGGLLPIAVDQSIYSSTDPPPSGASPLPQWFCSVAGLQAFEDVRHVVRVFFFLGQDLFEQTAGSRVFVTDVLNDFAIAIHRNPLSYQVFVDHFFQ